MFQQPRLVDLNQVDLMMILIMIFLTKKITIYLIELIFVLLNIDLNHDFFNKKRI